MSQESTRPIESFTRPNYDGLEGNGEYVTATPQGHGKGNHHTLARNAPPENKKFEPWKAFVSVVTCCYLPWCLRKCGKTDPRVQFAWREKMAIIYIMLFFCFLLAFFTFMLQSLICKPTLERVLLSSPPDYEAWAIHGYWYYIEPNYMVQQHPNSMNIIQQMKGGSREISALFANSFDSSACNSVQIAAPPAPTCQLSNGVAYCHQIKYQDIAGSSLKLSRSVVIEVGFEWEDVKSTSNYYTVYNGIVLDLREYFTTASNGTSWLPSNIDQVLRSSLGTDITRTIAAKGLQSYIPCLVAKYQVGFINKQTPGCAAALIMNILVLVIILSLVFIRLAMAVVFSCCMAPKLSKEPKGLVYIPPAVNLDQLVVQQQQQQQQYRRNSFSPKAQSRFSVYGGGQGNELMDASQENIVMNYISKGGNKELGNLLGTYMMVLVTCYSEGEEGIRDTLESIAESTYPSEQTLIFIVADGIVKGGGNDKSTPDICLGLINVDSESVNAPALSYVAVADGAKQHNMAKVYAGHFEHKGKRVPTMLVVKCGTPAEAKEAKPGNRGKRDSQIVLMNFLSKVMFDDRLTAMEYDLFSKIWKISGVPPDRFEILLMVDADTKIMPDSIQLMVNTFKNDVQIMGVCGETKIMNKSQSWVTAIQVYEYFISHHLSKNFESLFGGVTCLPGCFSAYRLKAPKGPNGFWVPILINPDVVEEYSQNVVETLHQKNLLLLGEDRFLSTLMLKTFPKRHTIFLPQACCKTVVPDTFSVLLSQRRRWINSTIHNLMELVFVKELCGIFCFSMQFVVFLDLISTIVLPAAIVFTVILIVSIATPKSGFVNDSLLPLLMLLCILVLPALCVIVFTRRFAFLMWLGIYLLALPIWNFVLPVYSAWKQDDFSWGKTRKVEGEAEGHDDHGSKSGIFDASQIKMKTWAEWEKEKRNKQRNPQSPMRDSSRSAVSPSSVRSAVRSPDRATNGQAMMSAPVISPPPRQNPQGYARIRRDKNLPPLQLGERANSPPRQYVSPRTDSTSSFSSEFPIDNSNKQVPQRSPDERYQTNRVRKIDKMAASSSRMSYFPDSENENPNMR